MYISFYSKIKCLKYLDYRLKWQSIFRKMQLILKQKQGNKMKTIKNTAIAMLAVVLLTFSSAYAGTGTMGVVVSAYNVEASGTETDKLTAAGANVADTSVRNKTVDDTTGTASFFMEYTLSDHSWPTTWGVEYTPGTANISDKVTRTDAETSITGQNITVANSTVRTAAAEATNFASAYLEAPIWGGLYARVGLSNIDIDYTTTDTSSVGGAYTDTISMTGTNLGIGYKGTTAGGTLYKLAYEQTDYDGFTLNSTGNSVAANSNTIKGDVDTSAFRISLGKSF